MKLQFLPDDPKIVTKDGIEVYKSHHLWNMINILHIFSDDKFFDITSNFFDVIPEVNNLYVFYTKERNYNFKFIRSVEKIRVVNSKRKYYSILKNKDIDIVYFHSLSPYWYKYLIKIPSKTKVVWWIWGYDIYYKWRECRALINIDLYKPITRNAIGNKKNRSISDCSRLIYYRMTYLKDNYIRKKAISRVDYVSPVIDLEYRLLSEYCPFFRARPFMIKSGPGIAAFSHFNKREPLGNILIGNSLTTTNNHLDIFDAIRACKLDASQKYIIPISYGNDIDKVIVKNSFQHTQALWLEEFIPRVEYDSIMNSVSYAVFGVIRQQAMGNIAYCLRNGIKIFLYSDSLVYKYLTSNGYTVYKIEDICETSFLNPLDEDAAIGNYSLLKNAWSDNVNYAYNEIQRILKKKGEE